jgi:hypothetical protein
MRFTLYSVPQRTTIRLWGYFIAKMWPALGGALDVPIWVGTAAAPCSRYQAGSKKAIRGVYGGVDCRLDLAPVLVCFGPKAPQSAYVLFADKRQTADVSRFRAAYLEANFRVSWTGKQHLWVLKHQPCACVHTSYMHSTASW